MPQAAWGSRREGAQPVPWTDDGIAQVGTILRQLHDTATVFQPPHPVIWQAWFGRDPDLAISR